VIAQLGHLRAVDHERERRTPGGHRKLVRLIAGSGCV
jgi:hypothetical protein